MPFPGRETLGPLLREAAERVILPHFRNLAQAEITEKAPGETVTRADREAEALITAHLLRLRPQARVIGEEAVSDNPALLARLDEGEVFLVDPLDGTANFAAARPPFAVMIAFLRQGETLASWMLDPVSGRLHEAERGGGAFTNGGRVRIAADAPSPQERRGAVFTRFLPPPLADKAQQRLPQIAQIVPGYGCAGEEYPDIATGGRHFAVFWRALPWDHAPGTLFLREAGGAVLAPDGSPYNPVDGRPGIIVARTPALAETLIKTFA